MNASLPPAVSLTFGQCQALRTASRVSSIPGCAWLLSLAVWMVAMSSLSQAQSLLGDANQSAIVHRANEVREREKVKSQLIPEAIPTVTPSGRPAVQQQELLKLQPQYMSARDLANAIAMAVGNQGSIAVLEGQDVVLVAGSPEVLQRSARMLEQVDVPRAQVRVTVYLYDVKIEESQQLASAALAQLKSQTVDASGMPLKLDDPMHLADVTRFHVLSRHLDMNQAVALLSESAGAKLLADPDLIVLDRQTTAFNVVTRVPTSSSTADKREANSPVSFEEAGIKLSISPRIANDASVEMHLATEYSTLAGFNQQSSPVIEVRKAETLVRVGDRQTLIIGGLRRQMTIESMQGVPGLMNWKVVGPLFRTVGTELSESELICILRPEIIGSAATAPTNIQSSSQSSALSNEPVSVVQSGVFQTPAISEASQIKPSAYRPSNYNKPPRKLTSPKNINGSQNSVTQPLPIRRG